MEYEDGFQLIGWICFTCGQRGVPRQTFGCERCGAAGDEIGESMFSARGVLRSFAEVHRHAKWPVPFVMGEISLDDGPTIHAFLDDAVEWLPGAEVVGQGGDLSRDSYLVFTAGAH
ncbi:MULTISPECIES: hypothetical protein [unclassified Microbacterium]|uniref:hypothetical protein n=1 Tax=unclassified Microbacterium TaxID=2609290 RepID=UPI0034665A6C